MAPSGLKGEIFQSLEVSTSVLCGAGLERKINAYCKEYSNTVTVILVSDAVGDKSLAA